MALIRSDKLEAAIEEFFTGVCVYDVAPFEAVRDFHSIIDGLAPLTDEEIKAEVRHRGYKMIKIPEPVKLLPCVCGRIRLSTPYQLGTGNKFYSCPKCGRSSMPSRTSKQAKINWNKMIQEEMTRETN